ncbi:MAG: alpha/beta hydrolase, partial [Kiritimatiellae bacterium]|nr:alpha/beta hydrolase [Kiritimatiellia bacterium]
MKKTMLALAFAAALPALAEVEYLWPDGKMPSKACNQEAVPLIDWYAAPEKPCGACCLLVTGGAYEGWADGWWIDHIAGKLSARGVQCVKILYRIPRPAGMPIYKTAWEDSQRAVRMIRSEAAKRGFDPEKIGALGFSAGAHAVVLLATSSSVAAYDPVDETDGVPCHLNWAIPIYTAYALTDGLEGPNATGGDGEGVKLDPLFKFDGKTCTMCMFHGGEDVYSPIASTRIYRKLRSMGIPAELHLFAGRNHGFMGDENRALTGYDTWWTRAEEFLRQMDITGDLGPQIPQSKRYSADFTA